MKLTKIEINKIQKMVGTRITSEINVEYICGKSNKAFRYRKYKKDGKNIVFYCIGHDAYTSGNQYNLPSSAINDYFREISQ